MYCFCRASRTIAIRIFLLDESEFLHEIQSNLSGQALLEVVFARLNLIETAYFGLRFLDVDGQTHWLDANTRISRQLRESKDVYELYFGVKFYAVDPCKLQEEITRYQFYLQLKQDVFQGRLPVAFDLATQLGAYVVQTELGDFDANKHSYGYVSEFRLINNQTKELELRVADNHRHLKGLSSAQAEFNYLDKVKWLDMYGVDLHPVLGEDSVEYFLGLTPSGIIVLRNKTTVAHYYWPRIAKVYFKGRYFMLRVCDKNNEISTYGFETPKKTACKHLWKCCVEHHAFFRLVRVSPIPPQAGPGDFFSLGSRFRYSGRTERQASKDAMVNKRNQPTFTRTPSRRQIRRSFEDTQDKKYSETNHLHKYEIKNVSIPQQAQPIESPYKSTCSIPASLNNKHSYRLSSVLDSPRSTRSAPWVKTQQRGLFGINSSPKSVRSATSRNDRSNSATNHRQRSSSVESHSSNDSKSTRRHRNRSKRMSDNESEMSRGSARSGRSHNSQHRKHRRHRSRHRSRDSEHGGSEHGSNYTYNDKYSVPPELVDSGKQWLEVQRQQAEKNSMGSVQKASVIKSTVPNVATTDTYNRKHKHRKHRSPSDHGNKIWSTELTKHLQFDLVETSGMTEDQLREIPYTVVETQQGRRRPNTNSLKVHKSSYGGKNAERVDRIRGLQNTEQLIDGSIRSGSTNSSSRDFDRNADIMRMMTSLSMGDFISPNVSNLNRVDSNGLRVSHEHTDSGLGADQDYAYSSERSSDSAKYGTNKSSGASVVSANIGNHPSTNHHHQQAGSRKPLQYNPRHNVSSTTITAPVHNKTIHSYDSNFNRLINNNHTHSPGVHYTFSLSRLGQGLHGVDNGVGNHVAISSPYNGYGVDQIRGTKSDVGGKLGKNRSHHSTLQVPKLPSVKSDLSIFENSFKDSSFFISDRINNNQPAGDNFHGKSGSKLLYNNKHRMEQNMANNNHQLDQQTVQGGNNAHNGNNGNSANINNNGNNVNMVAGTGGPLMYVNRDKKYCRRTNTIHNNNSAVQSSSDGLSGLTSSAETLDSPNNPSNSRNNSKTSSLELILSPIIQSRRAQL